MNADSRYYFKDPVESGKKAVVALYTLLWNLNLAENVWIKHVETDAYVKRMYRSLGYYEE
jgi:hypothetical protein